MSEVDKNEKKRYTFYVIVMIGGRSSHLFYNQNLVEAVMRAVTRQRRFPQVTVMFLVLAALIIGTPFGARAEEEESESPPSLAGAEEVSKPPLPDDVLSQIQEVAGYGGESLSAGNYADALARFDLAWNLAERRPEFAEYLFNIAFCERKMGLNQAAARHFGEFLGIRPKDKRARDELDEINKIMELQRNAEQAGKGSSDVKNDSNPPSSSPSPPPKKTRILSPFLLITGGLAAVAGGIALAVANGTEQDLIKSCMSRCPPEKYNAVNDQRLGGGLAIGGGAVFVVLGFVALGYGR